MTKVKKIIALLPMKAHSERVKGKNFRSLAQKPLFQWMLDTLLSIDTISKIVINTDAREILQEHGVEESPQILIRDRKSELCGDFTSMNLILGDDISEVNADIYLMTHTTNPLLSPATIRKSINKFIEAVEAESADSLFSVNRTQTRFYRENGAPVNHDPNSLVRTQDLEPWFEENSCLYLFTKQSFSKTQARIGENPMMFETPMLESIDIDGPEDWTMAEALALHNTRCKEC